MCMLVAFYRPTDSAFKQTEQNVGPAVTLHVCDACGWKAVRVVLVLFPMCCVSVA